MKRRFNYSLLSAQLCIVACVGDIFFLTVLGRYFPGYSQMKDTISHLGSSASPVSTLVSVWSVILGILFILFGIGFKRTYEDKSKIAGKVAWLIILYGMGEGILSGIFRVDQIPGTLSFYGIVHEFFSAIGVVAILILPIFAPKVIISEEPSFSIISKIVLIMGSILLLLFLFRFSDFKTNFISVYKGLWQRLFLLDFYIYLSTIACIIIKKERNSIDLQIS